MNDLTGFGKIAEVIIGALGKASGTVFEPTRIEREAHAQAKALLIQTEAEVQADKIRRDSIRLIENDSESSLRERAGQRVLNLETNRQENIERIATESVEQADSAAEPRQIEADWMNAFLRYAQDISADGVRELWANQATDNAPVVSRATLDAMRLLEPHHASHLERALQLFVGVGAILDTQPTEGLHYSFNTNDLLALALEDIGFLRRSRDDETSLALQDDTFTFWNPYQIVGPDWSLDSKDQLAVLLSHICSVTNEEQTSVADTGRKSIRIIQMQLSSRGYELAAVVHSQIYIGLSGDPSTRNATEFGPFADPEIRELIILEWVEQFSQQGAFVIRNR